MQPNSNPLMPDPGTVAMRLYGQGLGDCFLLAFAPSDPNDRPCYMVIDCGVAVATPGGAERMSKVVANIREATGGVIDVLAITHQHFDHISGFQQAIEEWKKFKEVNALYLPWTESTDDHGDGKNTEKLRKALEDAAKQAIEKAAENGSLADHPALQAAAGFLDVDESLFGAAGGGRIDMVKAMQAARDLCPDNIQYFRPGDVFRLPRTEFHGYVLGPPLPSTRTDKIGSFIELLVDDSEMYSYEHVDGVVADGGHAGRDEGRKVTLASTALRSLASGLGAVDAVLDVDWRGEDERYSPFESTVRLPWEEAMELDFFKNHYGDLKPDQYVSPERNEHGCTCQDKSSGNGWWRRVDNDWLANAGELAMRADGFTNNISLVLAFDIPNSEKMLLFPGDAQVGNWLSWHLIDGWNNRFGASPKNAPAAKNGKTLMQNLLGRVAFYKVGHHGSHNATIREKGLEMMTRDDLVAYIPISVPVAQDLMKYCPMPFYPVVRRIQEKTEGRVFMANGLPVLNQGEIGLRDRAERDAALLKASGIVPATDDLSLSGPKNLILDSKAKDGKQLEAAVPLYIEMVISPNNTIHPAH
jgi:hypothetical protein